MTKRQKSKGKINPLIEVDVKGRYRSIDIINITPLNCHLLVNNYFRRGLELGTVTIKGEIKDEKDDGDYECDNNEEKDFEAQEYLNDGEEKGDDYQMEETVPLDINDISNYSIKTEVCDEYEVPLFDNSYAAAIKSEVKEEVMENAGNETAGDDLTHHNIMDNKENMMIDEVTATATTRKKRRKRITETRKKKVSQVDIIRETYRETSPQFDMEKHLRKTELALKGDVIIVKEEYEHVDDRNGNSDGEWPIEFIVETKMPKPKKTQKNKKNRIGKKEVLVKWQGWPWETNTWMKEDDIRNGPDVLVEACESRERCVIKTAAAIKKRMPVTDFDTKFPEFKNRKDYMNTYRQDLRDFEESINAKLEKFGTGRVIFENWTNIPILPEFTYLTNSVVSGDLYGLLDSVTSFHRPFDLPVGCECIGSCTKICQCMTLTRNSGLHMNRLYLTKNGRLDAKRMKSAGIEGSLCVCGPSCTCSPQTCIQRAAHLIRKFPLVVLYTKEKGWGVFSPNKLAAGTYVGTYHGLISTHDEASSFLTYQFNIVGDENDELPLLVDAAEMGNEMRFFNHGCRKSANISPVNTYTWGLCATNNINFFTHTVVNPGEELTFTYNGGDGQSGNSRGIKCKCSHNCKHRL